jgi:predicted amidophosphoribosyltransferase
MTTNPLTTITDILFPLRCAGCDAEGEAFCARCTRAIDPSVDGPFEVHRTATANGPPVYAIADYRGAARAAVLAYKERGRRDLAVPLARMLACVVPWLPGARSAEDGTWWLVPAPSKASAARRRGGPHMLRLARAVAAVLAENGHPAAVAPALRLTIGTRDSVGLDRDARAANLAGRLRFVPSGTPPSQAPVVLLDDVVTTGATAAACVRALTTAGIVVSAVLALTAA